MARSAHGPDREQIGDPRLQALVFHRSGAGCPTALIRGHQISAIVGIFHPNGKPIGFEEIGRMVESVAHRGPDGVDKWAYGPVGLGHRLLFTTPQSLHEKLPLVDEGRGLVLTADARIDNRDELIEILELPDRTGQGISDSELILRAYERWGERCPERLLGDFAFALWDRRRQVLFCARDHMGVKPFYYHHVPGRLFVFGSEIKALLCVEGVPRRLNEVMVADYLVLGPQDQSITFYQDILRLPPAHIMSVSQKGALVRPYWSLDPTIEVRLRSDEEYAEAFREVFTEAVSCRLRSALPVGSLLSGGLDSSSIVCVARDLLAERGREGRLQTFSAVFPEVPECDESVYIDTVVAQGGVDAHRIRADRLSPLANWKRVLWHLDEPSYIGGVYLGWGLYNAAQQQGVRVLLEGTDGDTIVSHGFEYLTELSRSGRWGTLAAEINALSRLPNNKSAWDHLWRYGLKPLAPVPVRQIWRMRPGRNRSPWLRDTVIGPGFARRIRLSERVQILEEARSKPARNARESHWGDLTSSVHAADLEILDKNTAAFAIESRYPFYDRRLVEFCLALPPEQKLNRGWTRMVMRRALAGSLPEEIRWRADKTRLAANHVRNLLLFERELIEEMVLYHPGTLEEYVDMDALRSAYYRYVSCRSRDDAFEVWNAVSLALWLRHTSLTP